MAIAGNVICSVLRSIAGWVLGTPETEEAQNRMIALKNRVVVVSVDYRKSAESARV